tara:strand:+ start:1261 stop:1536 length:276 start_codon:yes stop_codon:yes gene_type:complete
MKTALTFLKNHWKRMTTLFVLSMVGTFAALQVYKNGIDLGKQVGRCEITCVLFMGDFIALDGEGCQCELATGFTVTIPLDPDFFEISLTEE